MKVIIFACFLTCHFCQQDMFEAKHIQRREGMGGRRRRKKIKKQAKKKGMSTEF